MENTMTLAVSNKR